VTYVTKNTRLFMSQYRTCNRIEEI